MLESLSRWWGYYWYHLGNLSFHNLTTQLLLVLNLGDFKNICSCVEMTICCYTLRKHKAHYYKSHFDSEALNTPILGEV